MTQQLTESKNLIKKLKTENPAKFLELIPEITFSAMLEKMASLNVFGNLSGEIYDEIKKDIDMKLKSGYNIHKIVLGSLIFLIGRHLTAKHSSKKYLNKQGG